MPDRVRRRGFTAPPEKGNAGLRTAFRLIARLQDSEPAIRRWFPHPLPTIKVKGGFRYRVPAHFLPEVEALLERASRQRYIRAKEAYEYVKEKTRIGMRTTLHAVVDALIATKRLDPDASTFAHHLTDTHTLADVVGHIARRVESGEITARHATVLIGRLAVVLERNGMDAEAKAHP